MEYKKFSSEIVGENGIQLDATINGVPSLELLMLHIVNQLYNLISLLILGGIARKQLKTGHVCASLRAVQNEIILSTGVENSVFSLEIHYYYQLLLW